MRLSCCLHALTASLPAASFRNLHQTMQSWEMAIHSSIFTLLCKLNPSGALLLMGATSNCIR